MIDSYPLEWEESLKKVLAMVLRRYCGLWGRGT
jgi:hypothetical protein